MSRHAPLFEDAPARGKMEGAAGGKIQWRDPDAHAGGLHSKFDSPDVDFAPNLGVKDRGGTRYVCGPTEDTKTTLRRRVPKVKGKAARKAEKLKRRLARAA